MLDLQGLFLFSVSYKYLDSFMDWSFIDSLYWRSQRSCMNKWENPSIIWKDIFFFGTWDFFFFAERSYPYPHNSSLCSNIQYVVISPDHQLAFNGFRQQLKMDWIYCSLSVCEISIVTRLSNHVVGFDGDFCTRD